MKVMNKEEIDLLLGLIKHGWETGVVRGEAGAVQLTLLRVKLEEMKKPKPPELVK